MGFLDTLCSFPSDEVHKPDTLSGVPLIFECLLSPEDGESVAVTDTKSPISVKNDRTADPEPGVDRAVIVVQMRQEWYQSIDLRELHRMVCGTHALR